MQAKQTHYRCRCARPTPPEDRGRRADLDLPDGWVCGRSVTQPAVTCRFEAADHEKLAELVDQFCEKLPGLGDRLWRPPRGDARRRLDGYTEFREQEDGVGAQPPARDARGRSIPLGKGSPAARRFDIIRRG